MYGQGGKSIVRLNSRVLAVLAITTLIATFAGCGGGSTSSGASQPVVGSGGPTSVPGTALVQVRVGDAPADRVISFELSIANPITLTSSSGSKAPLQWATTGWKSATCPANSSRSRS